MERAAPWKNWLSFCWRYHCNIIHKNLWIIIDGSLKFLVKWTESKEAEVKKINLRISSPGREDVVLPISSITKSKRTLFTLKEGSHYRLFLSFTVSNNIVSGLKYITTVWKTGVRGQLIFPMSFLHFQFPPPPKKKTFFIN